MLRLGEPYALGFEVHRASRGLLNFLFDEAYWL